MNNKEKFKKALVKMLVSVGMLLFCSLMVWWIFPAKLIKLEYLNVVLILVCAEFIAKYIKFTLED